MDNPLLVDLRLGKPLTLPQQIQLTARLSMPAILAQFSTIAMQYIDASMVGRLGSDDAAAIGLVSSSTWLPMGLSRAVVVGFSVLVAQQIGARNEKDARNLVRQAMLICFLFSLLLCTVCAAVAGPLPRLLHADPVIWANATAYYRIFALSLPAVLLNRMAAGLLQASGNMKTPSVLMIVMCALDVLFNSMLIFPAHEVFGIMLPGAGLGVAGASLGTALSEVVVMILMVLELLFRCPALRLRREERLHLIPAEIRSAVRVGIPVAVERVVVSSAQILSTGIVAPLGSVSIAAHSFAVTAEGLCYMPGYGIQSAAVTLIGQSVGARRQDIINRLAWVTVLMGMIIMSAAALLMYIFAPQIIHLLSPDMEVVALGAQVLRIEVFAEPMFGAAIITAGIFQGAGKSLISSALNLCCMWGIRIPLTFILVPRMGLIGAWVAMVIELVIRGSLFLISLARKKWIPKSMVFTSPAAEA